MFVVVVIVIVIGVVVGVIVVVVVVVVVVIDIYHGGMMVVGWRWRQRGSMLVILDR